MVARLTPDQTVGSSILSGLRFFSFRVVDRCFMDHPHLEVSAVDMRGDGISIREYTFTVEQCKIRYFEIKNVVGPKKLIKAI